MTVVAPAAFQPVNVFRSQRIRVGSSLAFDEFHFFSFHLNSPVLLSYSA